MFEYLFGIIQEKSPDQVIIDVGGIGYEISIPLSTFNALPEQSQSVKIFTHFHVREDIQKLFGFSTKAEREVFRQLLTINQVGPKVALNVLSGLTVRDIVLAVQSADANRFKAVSGIGPKTAQRLVLELKGKLSGVGVEAKTEGITGLRPTKTSDNQLRPDARSDAYSALISLGYNDSQVLNALKRVEEIIGPKEPVEQWIKMALKVV